MVWIVSSVTGSCFAALNLRPCLVSVGLCVGSRNGEQVTGVDFRSSRLCCCVYNNLLGFSWRCVSKN